MNKQLKKDSEYYAVSEAKSAIKVSKDGRVNNAHLLGFESRNNRKYTPEAMKAAVEAKLYNDVNIFLNHDGEDVGRSGNYTNKIGYVVESRFSEKFGIVGDVQLNTGHPYYESAVWWIENQPSKVGFSHVAPVKESEDGVVTAIGKPYSVDLVSFPATTNGILAMEGVIEDVIQEKRLNAIWCALSSQYTDISYPLDGPMLTQEEQALNLIPVLQDAIAELSKLGNTKTTQEESVMDLKTLTLDLLKAERPDLTNTIATEAVKADRAIDAAVLEAVKALASAAKTEVFLALVREAVQAGKDVTAIVADRAALTVVVESASFKAPEQKPAVKTEAVGFDATTFESLLTK